MKGLTVSVSAYFSRPSSRPTRVFVPSPIIYLSLIQVTGRVCDLPPWTLLTVLVKLPLDIPPLPRVVVVFPSTPVLRPNSRWYRRTLVLGAFLFCQGHAFRLVFVIDVVRLFTTSPQRGSSQSYLVLVQGKPEVFPVHPFGGALLVSVVAHLHFPTYSPFVVVNIQQSPLMMSEGKGL